MIQFRSFVFVTLFVGWTLVMCLAWLPALAGPRIWTPRGQTVWAKGVLWLLRTVAGIGFEIRGREHLPEGACVIASKHQSAWDTIVWHLFVEDPAIVMKKELLSIPLYGWYSRKARMIPVDRKAGAAALKAMLRAATEAADAGRPLIIFPEGTRSAPGQRIPYQPGAAALYRHLGLPVVPVAVNSGLRWPKTTYLKTPGTIVLEYLDPIEPGSDKRAFMAELEERIETASQRLLVDNSVGNTGT